MQLKGSSSSEGMKLKLRHSSFFFLAGNSYGLRKLLIQTHICSFGYIVNCEIPSSTQPNALFTLSLCVVGLGNGTKNTFSISCLMDTYLESLLKSQLQQRLTGELLQITLALKNPKLIRKTQ